MSEDLGECVLELKASSSGLVKVVLIMLGSFAVALLFCGISLGGTGEALGGRIVLFVLGLLFSLPGLLGIYGLTRGRNNALRVYEQGIVVHTAGRDQRVSWDEIESYIADAFLRIETKSDDTIVFGLGGVGPTDDVMARLREEVVMRRWLPKVQAMLREGDTVELGEFTIDAVGITLPNSESVLPWPEILECSTTQRVTSTGRHASPQTFVLLKTATRTLDAAVDATSDRELLVALCHAQIAR